MSAPPRAKPVCRAKPSRRTWLAALVIKVAVIGLMVTGEYWMLEHPASAANELIVATCVVDAIFGDAKPTDTVCAATRESIDKEGKL